MEYRPEALLFDMFGTVFDWRTTVVEALKSTFEQKLSSQTSLDNGMQIPTVPPQTIKTAQKIAEQEDFWPKFAQGIQFIILIQGEKNGSNVLFFA